MHLGICTDSKNLLQAFKLRFIDFFLQDQSKTRRNTDISMRKTGGFSLQKWFYAILIISINTYNSKYLY